MNNKIGRLPNCARMVFLIIAIILLASWGTSRRDTLYAFGCDAFGYGQQAKLFRDKGFIRGLDTRIETSEQIFLTETAKAIESNYDKWIFAIAPICYHYKQEVDKIILQYPPGTGFVLSMFPEVLSLYYVFVIGMLLVALLIVFVCFTYSSTWSGICVSIVFYGLLSWTMLQAEAFSSYSIILSVPLIPVCIILSFYIFSTKSNLRLLIATAFGFLSGFLVSVRLPNIFILLGILTQIYFAQKLWRLENLIKSSLVLILALIAFCLAIFIFLLSANYINTDSIFRTTYSSFDASPAIFSIDFTLERLRFYFTEGFAAPLLIIASLSIIARVYFLIRYSRERDWGPTLGALTCLCVSILFFSTHFVHISYYLLPASISVVFMILFDILINRNMARINKPKGLNLFFYFTPFLIFLLIKFVTFQPNIIKTNLPSEVKLTDAILWADISSGTTYYYENKFSSKINYADLCTQNKLIDNVARAGRIQYFIEDGQDMRKIIERLKITQTLEQVGYFNAHLPLPLWRLKSNDYSALPPC